MNPPLDQPGIGLDWVPVTSSDVTYVLSPDRAVEILRMASLSNHMSLLIARDDESR